MSRIDDLIAELCPEGVEFVELGKLLAYEQPTKYLVDSTAYSDSYATPVLTAGQTFVLGRTDETNGIYPASTATPVIIFDDFTTAFKWVDFPFKVKSSAMKMLTPKDAGRASLRYIYYVMQTIRYEPQDHARQWIGIYSGFQVPVPPLEVQREIVRVLDQFTQLEAELEAELEARRRQYEHYRVVLLNSSDDGGVRDVSLGEIIRLNFGARITKKDNAGTIYPVYGGGGESFRTDAFNREDEWVISRFAMSANCVRRVTGKFWMLDSGFTFDVTDATVDKDFVGQLLLSMQPTIFATSTQSAQKNIDVDGFKRLRVQIPSLDTQRRVASALANFDGIVNDLSSGLPAELAARRKQYEYYRDKLLTFEESVV